MLARRSFASAAAAYLVAFGFSPAAAAAPGDADAAKGLAAAKRGDCVKAVPLLEQAELARHKPSTAMALAGCYVAEGELIKASDLYHAVADEKPNRAWKRDDVTAQKSAAKKAQDVDARIPTLRFEAVAPYEDLEVSLNGKPVGDLDKPKQVTSDTKVHITATAKGKKPLADDIVLAERERRTYSLRLEPKGKGKGGGAATATPGGEEAPGEKPPEDKAAHPIWVGARFRGVILPKFVQRLFVDGGRELIGPGFGGFVAIPVGGVEVIPSLSYVDYSLADTPFKGKNAPDTEWEIDSSTLKALLLEVDLAWNIPLDDEKNWNVRLGGGVGLGWAFAGDLFRTQAFPRNLKPGDPYTYEKCKGPNDPLGSFRYCNTLDKDAKFYNGYKDADWFHGGLRPTIYPWVVLPEVGISWRFLPHFAAEASFGVTITGFVFGGGVKYSL
jgi:hypothetical protein